MYKEIKTGRGSVVLWGQFVYSVYSVMKRKRVCLFRLFKQKNMCKNNNNNNNNNNNTQFTKEQHTFTKATKKYNISE